MRALFQTITGFKRSTNMEKKTGFEQNENNYY